MTNSVGNAKLSLHPVACIRSGSGASVQRNSLSVVVYYFIQIIRYMFPSYDHLQVEIVILNLGLCILLRVLDQVQGFPSNATLFQ
jgi:hypothetical protein